MSDFTRRDEAAELHDYIAQLEAECKELKAKLQEMNLVLEHDRQTANLEQLKQDQELRYRDGVIAGLKYAIRCNGVSGGEVS